MLSLERKMSTALVGKFDCAPLPRYDNLLVPILCSERIPEPYEHQRSYSQEINYFIREDIENFWEKKMRLYRHRCNKQKMTVRKPTYSCHNKHSKLVDSLKQNLKKI